VLFAIGAVVTARAAVFSKFLPVAAAGVAEGYQVVEGVFTAVSDGFEVEGLDGAFAFAGTSLQPAVAAGEIVTLVHSTADIRGGSEYNSAIRTDYASR
jgi:hypothetical protein